MPGHWQILGGHPGGMGPKKKRKGQYSPFVDYKEPQRWRKKMDIGGGLKPVKQRVEESIESIFMESKKSQDSFEEKINQFTSFARDFLELESVPAIKFTDESEEGMTTACYDAENGTIKVLRADRALFDICRSIAHELVHRSQHETKDASDIDGEAGSHDEDEANALAGEIVRLYGDQNSSFYEE